MRRAQFSPRARRDALDAMRWIMGNNPWSAHAFHVAVDEATILLGNYPLVGKERPELIHPPVRVLPLTGFPYLLVYDSGKTPPLILRVLHGARDLPVLLSNLDHSST